MYNNAIGERLEKIHEKLTARLQQVSSDLLATERKLAGLRKVRSRCKKRIGKVKVALSKETPYYDYDFTPLLSRYSQVEAALMFGITQSMLSRLSRKGKLPTKLIKKADWLLTIDAATSRMLLDAVIGAKALDHSMSDEAEQNAASPDPSRLKKSLPRWKQSKEIVQKRVRSSEPFRGQRRAFREGSSL